MQSAQDYDLIVIGSGPAGEKGAAQAAYFDKRVALIERDSVLGGASCNTGALSSKTLRESALALSGFRSRELFGVDLAVRRGATVHDFLTHERMVVAAEREAIRENVRRHKINTYHGLASFIDRYTVRVDTEGGEPLFLRGEVILIATGSSPIRPPQFCFDDRRVWDSDQIVNLDFMPGRMAVIGGGVIGCEYACTFAALGVDVCLVDGRTELLDFVDRDVWAVLETAMMGLGIRFLTGERVLECSSSAAAVTLSLSSGRTVEVDAVLVAAGRIANTEQLNLKAAGLTADGRGRVAVNEHYQTEVSHIYAAGDVIGFPALASTSMEQARVAMVDAFNLKYKKSAAPVLPLGVFTIPEVSVAGETERSLTAQRIPYIAGRAYYDGNARGKIIGDRKGLLKLLFREHDMKLLGVSVVGESASELVHIGVIALMLDADHDLFIETCFNYPTLGQLYKYATYDAMGKRRGAPLAGVTSARAE